MRFLIWSWQWSWQRSLQSSYYLCKDHSWFTRILCGFYQHLKINSLQIMEGTSILSKILETSYKGFTFRIHKDLSRRSLKISNKGSFRHFTRIKFLPISQCWLWVESVVLQKKLSWIALIICKDSLLAFCTTGITCKLACNNYHQSDWNHFQKS